MNFALLFLFSLVFLVSAESDNCECINGRSVTDVNGYCYCVCKSNWGGSACDIKMKEVKELTIKKGKWGRRSKAIPEDSKATLATRIQLSAESLRKMTVSFSSNLLLYQKSDFPKTTTPPCPFVLKIITLYFLFNIILLELRRRLGLRSGSVFR